MFCREDIVEVPMTSENFITIISNDNCVDIFIQQLKENGAFDWFCKRILNKH